MCMHGFLGWRSIHEEAYDECVDIKSMNLDYFLFERDTFELSLHVYVFLDEFESIPVKQLNTPIR
jgi:hypothetical protein